MNTINEKQNITLSEKLIDIIRNKLNKDGNLHLLKRLDKIIKWDDITGIVSKYLPEASGGTYRDNKVLTLIKCLILENIFNLSDYRLYVELADKDTYQNFIGIDSPTEIPKVKIMTSFRSILMLNNIYDMIIEKFNEQLYEGKNEILNDSLKDEEKKHVIINVGYIYSETLHETKILEIEERIRKLYEDKLSSMLSGMDDENANDVKDKLLRVKIQIDKLSGEKFDPEFKGYQNMLNIEDSIINISGIADELENNENSNKEEPEAERTEELHDKIINSFFVSLEDNDPKNRYEKITKDDEEDNIIKKKLKYTNSIIEELKNSLKNLDEIAASKESPEPEKITKHEQLVEKIENENFLDLHDIKQESINVDENNIPYPLVILPSKKTEGIFNDENLTEDYELGFRFHQLGLKMGFFNVMLDSNNEATRISTAEFFPNTFWSSVKQRSRWIAGVCFQNWKANKWKGNLTAKYFMFRDRKPLFNIPGVFLSNIIFIYMLFAVLSNIFNIGGLDFVIQTNSILWYILVVNLFFMLSRTVHRFAFTYNWYGFRFGFFSMIRIVIDTFINFFAVLRSLKVYRQTKKKVVWDSTNHY